MPDGRRRLAAIMYTDIVGYTALTQSNEAQAMEVLDRHNRLLRPFFPRFHGREVKAIGDSFLVEFESALDALRCATEIQSYLHDYNISSKEEWKIKLRIGIHLGDVIHKGGDVFGDAVNIASRVEPIAEPEGICVSEQLYDQVHNKVELPFASLGERILKNVGETIELFKVMMPWERKAAVVLPVVGIGAGANIVSTGLESLDKFLGGGYPGRSSILVIGQPGIGKEALGYWFTRSGLIHGDYCLYVTHRVVSDVLRDMRAYGVPDDHVPDWIAGSGASAKCDLSDYTSIMDNIKKTVERNSSKRIRVVTDVISPLLVMNPQPAIYQYLSELLGKLKSADLVILAFVEEGMHSESTVTALEQQFDGVIELRLYEEGLSITPLLRVRKMLGLAPLHGYFKFTFSKSGMEVLPYVR